MNLYLGQGAPTHVLSHWQTTYGWTRQSFYGVLVGNCFIGITRWSKSNERAFSGVGESSDPPKESEPKS